ncbi:uncharacterized protein LOC108911603 [Anoplophora glabripennis]|uniref:uncharacterized protein LOC108911603 n=1 Tax=Anoplophora glabripennis TaxID=217634 RepID=UPI000C7899C5|nr:uncharacterized protein LOC108911603 [Anoplophora glabripennis]
MEEYIVPLKPKKCCVPNCLNRSSKRHRFPKSDIDLFKTWLQIIKPVDCDELTIEQIYNRCYVCEDHFSSECFVPGTRRGLTRNAVPTLLIPAYSGFKDISGEVLSINISTTTSSTSSEMLTPSTAVKSSVYVSDAEMAGPSTRSPTPGPLSFTEIPALSKEGKL